MFSKVKDPSVENYRSSKEPATILLKPGEASEGMFELDLAHKWETPGFLSVLRLVIEGHSY